MAAGVIYEYPQSDILDALREVSNTIDVTFACRSTVVQAIAAFAQHGAYLADRLIYYEAVEQGRTQVLFSRQSVPGDRAVSPPRYVVAGHRHHRSSRAFSPPKAARNVGTAYGSDVTVICNRG